MNYICMKQYAPKCSVGGAFFFPLQHHLAQSMWSKYWIFQANYNSQI